MFHRDFMDYHQHCFQDASVMVFKNDKLIALFPANKVNDVIYSHQGLTYGGLIIPTTLKLHIVLVAFKELLEYYLNKGFSDLVLKIIPSIYNDIPSDELLYLSFLLEAQLIRRDTLSVVSQKKPIKYSKDRIDGIKRAEKHGLIIKDDDEFDAFWNEILIVNLQKKHQAKPVHSLDEIKLLKKRFPNNIKQFNVYHDNKLVAGTTIFITKHVAHSQYISGNEDKNAIGSLDFLHEYLLNTAFVDKRYFDFGISNENQGKQINSGLQYWKEGFGSRTVVQDFYKIPIANYNKLDNVLL